MSPDVKSKVYSTTEAQMSTETVVIVEFGLTCKNKPRVCYDAISFRQKLDVMLQNSNCMITTFRHCAH